MLVPLLEAMGWMEVDVEEEVEEGGKELLWARDAPP
jgi:hypothetical protein